MGGVRQRPCASTVQFLLARGALLDSTDDAQMTPLHATCARAAGHDEVARFWTMEQASIR